MKRFIPGGFTRSLFVGVALYLGATDVVSTTVALTGAGTAILLHAALVRT
jgi:hypothetical protein